MRNNEPGIDTSTGKVFAEPWEAEAFALALTLSSRGLFSWQEWTATLAEELQEGGCGAPSQDGKGYYHHWLTALERLVKHKGILDGDALRTRKIEWIEAFSSTPHGQPVALRR